jgi:hypothetical protein
LQPSGELVAVLSDRRRGRADRGEGRDAEEEGPRSTTVRRMESLPQQRGLDDGKSSIIVELVAARPTSGPHHANRTRHRA